MRGISTFFVILPMKHERTKCSTKVSVINSNAKYSNIPTVTQIPRAREAISSLEMFIIISTIFPDGFQ